MTTEKKENKKGLLIIFAVLLGLSIVGNVIQFTTNKETVETLNTQVTGLETSVDELNKEVADAKETVKSLQGENSELNEEVASKLKEIERIKAENDSLVKSGMNKDELNRRLRANLALVKKLNNELESKVEELLAANKKLTGENTELQTNVDSLNSVTKGLTAKVELASTLSAEYIEVQAYKKRSEDKYRSTKLAKRTNKIELTCKIMMNPITEQGEKQVLLKIVSPEGKTMGNFGVNGDKTEKQSNGAITYADFKSFTYTGEEQDLTLKYETEERNFPKGNYLLEVIIEGQVSAATTFTLK